MKLEEVARLAGVSRTTASYVVNGKAEKHRISAHTQERVLAVVKKHNYRPNPTASALRAGMSRTIGLVIPDLENASYAKIAKLLECKARESGYQLIICGTDDNPETEINLVNALVSRKIDALIVASALSPNTAFYPEILSKGIPIIAIDRALDDALFSSVISEDLEGAYQLTHRLIDNDISSLGLIGAMPEFGISKEREQGFLCAVQKAKRPYHLAYGHHFSQEEGKQLILHWHKQNILPDAILTTSYALFEGVLDAILDCPEIGLKTKFATFGDNRMLNFIPIKVHSLPQQLELLCERALKLTFKGIAGQYQTGIEVIPRKPLWRQ